MSARISIDENGEPAYRNRLLKVANIITKHKDQHLVQTFNDLVSVFQELEAYASDLEMDNLELMKEKQRADRLQVYLVLFKRNLHMRALKGESVFIKNTDINKEFRYSDEYMELLGKALIYDGKHQAQKPKTLPIDRKEFNNLRSISAEMTLAMNNVRELLNKSQYAG